MAVHPLKDLGRVLKHHARVYERNTTKIMRGGLTTCHEELMVWTPVDKGILVSNWIVTVGAPANHSVLAYAPGEKLGRDEKANKAGARAAASPVIKTYTPAQSDVPAHITNNVRYVVKIEAESNQSAPHFAQLAIQSTRNFFHAQSIFPD